jgi:alkaline phosphatase D
MTPPDLPRRRFIGASLAGAAAVGLAACSDDGDDSTASTQGTEAPAATNPPPELSGDPFTLGVASGDPTPEAVILWTRLLTEAKDVPEEDIDVSWELAADESFDDVVASGTATAAAKWGHAVHVDADGLDPATGYWYRFTVGDATSPVGRTRTAAAEGDDPVRYAMCTCQGYSVGYYTAHRYMAEEDFDFVMFNGDFIYDFEANGNVRPTGLQAPVTLEEYRAIYEVGLSDPDLTANRSAHPWIVTWDDHEVEDNYAGLVPGQLSQMSGTGAGDFAGRRAAAYQAWWEHQPVRSPEPDGPDLPIYRSFRFGDVLTMPVIDTRQYRDEQVQDGVAQGTTDQFLMYGDQTPAVFAEDLQMLGAEQEDWLMERIDEADTAWLVVSQQTIMGGWNLDPTLPDGRWSMDTWDGYVAQRARVLEALAAKRAEGEVAVASTGGDLHHTVVQSLRRDPTTADSEVIGPELICPSITSTSSETPEQIALIASEPYIQFYDGERRGYMAVTVTPSDITADVVFVDATIEDAPKVDGGSFRATTDDPVPAPA